MKKIWNLFHRVPIAIVLIAFFYLFLACPIAQADPVPERPLVLVPGIIGSQLCEDSGAVVWGNRWSLWNLEKLEITGRPTDKKLKPCGLVEQIQILGKFWTVDQYNLLLAALKGAGYEQSKKNLFLFAYDWRQSNVETAKLLSELIQKTQG